MLFGLSLLSYKQFSLIACARYFDTSPGNFAVVTYGSLMSLLPLVYMEIIFRGEPPHRMVIDNTHELRSLYCELLLLTDTTILFIGALTLPYYFSDIHVVGLLHMLLLVFYYVILFLEELLWRHMHIRAWHARACVGVFNWKRACAALVKELSIRKTNRRNDKLKHFKWTCVSLQTLGKIKSMSCRA